MYGTDLNIYIISIPKLSPSWSTLPSIPNSSEEIKGPKEELELGKYRTRPCLFISITERSSVRWTSGLYHTCSS